MANQSASPKEAAIARKKLSEMTEPEIIVPPFEGIVFSFDVTDSNGNTFKYTTSGYSFSDDVEKVREKERQAKRAYYQSVYNTFTKK